MRAWQDPETRLALVVVSVAALVTWLVHDEALRESMFTVFMYAALASSLNILLGYTGYVSFGHVVFFGLGGYVGFYLLSQHRWSLAAAAAAGGVASALLAGGLGLAIFRLRGPYFALATLGINEAARAFVNNFGPFGGPAGLSIDFGAYSQYGGPRQALWMTFILLSLTLLALLVSSSAVKHSRFGLGLLAIREDENAASIMGVPAARYKIWAFLISALVPGIVGTLFFFKNGNVQPGDAFRMDMSVEILVLIMLGGQGTVFGPVLGAGLYEWLRSFLLTSPLFKDLQLAAAGLVLLLIVLFMPGGLMGWMRVNFMKPGRHLHAPSGEKHQEAFRGLAGTRRRHL